MVAAPAEHRARPLIGQWVTGIDVPVVNERAVRAAAGLLFASGFAAWLVGAITGDLGALRAFGVAFALEMQARLVVGTRWSPLLALGTLLTRPQRPEWVDAESKKLAWGLGLGVALAGCLALGWLALPAVVAQSLCALCLALLFAESALGYCVGCELARRFATRKPTLCSGDTCVYVPPQRGVPHHL